MLPGRAENATSVTLVWPGGSSVKVVKGDRLVATVAMAGANRRLGALFDQAMLIAACDEKANVSGRSDDWLFSWGADTDPANPEPASMRFRYDDDRIYFDFDFDVRRAKGQTWETVLDTYAALDLE